MKIAIIGAGRVGSTTAFSLMKEGLADEVVLIDILENLVKGEALDLGHCHLADVKGSTNYAEVAGCDLAIIVAGVARKPDMTRLDLLKINAGIVKSAAQQIAKHAPNAKILVVTNPMDVMTYVALKHSGFGPKRVFGMGNLLDTLRFRYLIAKEFNVPPSAVEALVVGEHGDSMVPLASSVKIGGIPAAEKEKIADIAEKAKFVAKEVIATKGATFYAPAVAITKLVSAMQDGNSKPQPVSAYLDEYKACAGVLVKFGSEGVDKILIPEMEKSEKLLFIKSVKTLRGYIEEAESNGLF
jgi:malate/lactate dehydrogenase